MLVWYKKFCCGIFYLLKEKANSDIPLFATFMFTLFLFVLVTFGIESLVYLLFKTEYNLNKYIVYLLVVIIAIPNYLYVFKNSKFLDFYTEKFALPKTIIIVLFIFLCSLILVLQGGVRVDTK